MALTNLAGLNYQLPDLARNTHVQASTFLDWCTLTLTNHDDASSYLGHADAAIASGSNALGFPPKQLDRSQDQKAYKDAGLIGFPADGLFWYTDGGTVDNEPLGRTIDLAQGIASDDERLYLLIHPDPGVPTPTGPSPWSGDTQQPAWVRTGTHSFSISRAQSIYEDLKRLQKMNSRLQWIEKVGPAIEDGLNDAVTGAGLSASQLNALRENLTRSSAQALAEIRGQQTEVADQAGRAPRTPRADDTDDSASLASAIGALVRAASGLEARVPIKVEVVSPIIDPRVADPPSKQLAGAFFFHFGGFFAPEFRQSDFALGFRNMQYWLENCLGNYVQDPALPDAVAAVDAAYHRLGWDQIRFGGAQLGELSGHQQLELGELALHIGHVIGHDFTHGGV